MSIPTKILIVEHDPYDLELLQFELEKVRINFVSEVVQNEQDYIHALTNFVPDIILTDFTLPYFDGPSAFKIKEKLAPDTPFIFVSGTIGEERSIELIGTGVTDYVLKDNLVTLNHKISRALRDAKHTKQKKETERALIESERGLAMAQQMAHMGSWELNFASNDIKWSAETYRIYGLNPELKRQSFEFVLSFVHAEDLPVVQKTFQESRNPPHLFAITFRILRPNGSTRHIYLEGKPEFDSGGIATGFYGIAHDVTDMVILENKIAEEQLTRQKEITDSVFTALENERAVIGYELNENLNQILAAAKVYLHLSAKSPDKSEKFLNLSSGFITEAMQEIRKLSKSLVIHATHIVSLADNIKNLVQDISQVHSLVIEFNDKDIKTGLLHEKLQLNIFRIIQEQVNNILLHSNATRATISLCSTKNKVVLLISDNGEGCDVLQETNGVGIINIRTRAALFDGTVTIVSKPGEGYKLKVEMSLNADITRLKTVKAV